MHFDCLEAIELERYDLAVGCFLNLAVGRPRVEAMDQSLGKPNRLQFRLERLLDLAKTFGDVQGVVFFSP